MDSYQQSPRMVSIAEKIIVPGHQKMLFTNVSGSFGAVIFSVLYLRQELNAYNHLIILEDAEEAAYFHNDLEQLIQPLDLFYFPSSFKTNKNFRTQSSSHVMLRTEALT